MVSYNRNSNSLVSSEPQQHSNPPLHNNVSLCWPRDEGSRQRLSPSLSIICHSVTDNGKAQRTVPHGEGGGRNGDRFEFDSFAKRQPSASRGHPLNGQVTGRPSLVPDRLEYRPLPARAEPFQPLPLILPPVSSETHQQLPASSRTIQRLPQRAEACHPLPQRSIKTSRPLSAAVNGSARTNGVIVFSSVETTPLPSRGSNQPLECR